jgi:hypothetical protein
MKTTAKRHKDSIDFSSFPKWGSDEHNQAEERFFAERGPQAPFMPLITDAEFNRLQNLAAKYR